MFFFNKPIYCVPHDRMQYFIVTYKPGQHLLIWRTYIYALLQTTNTIFSKSCQAQNIEFFNDSHEMVRTSINRAGKKLQVYNPGGS
jgi:hypothetical protein